MFPRPSFAPPRVAVRPSTPKTWVLKSPAAPELAERLQTELGVPGTFARLLASRGFTSSQQVESFLIPSTDRLIDAFIMRDMDRAVDRVLQAVEAREPILVYGDYDVDGITSTS